MAQPPRYLFLLPDVTRPVGGVNVALQIIDVLQDAGYEAVPVYGSASHSYDFAPCAVPARHWSPLEQVPRQFMGRKARLRGTLKRLTTGQGKAVTEKLTPRADDVIVVPEFWYPEFSDLFPDHRRVLLAQDAFGLARAFLRDRTRATPRITQFAAACTTSEASGAAADYIAGLSSHRLRLCVTRPGLSFTAQKKKQIAYMPRRRPQEIEIVLAALQNRPALAGWSFKPIDKVGFDELDAILRESLIFLAFSHQEGFGLPPAEAMATGAIAVGYTGVGGEEYFRPEFGFPVPDSDIVGFARTVEQVVTTYDSDPAPLDAMRKRASEHIHANYGFEAMREAVLTTWETLHAGFS